MTLSTRRICWAFSLLLGALGSSWLGWGAQAERAALAQPGGPVRATRTTVPAAVRAFAATITVNSTAQEVTQANPNGVANGNCTLGEAILSANTNSNVGGCAISGSGAPFTIVLANNTYTLTQRGDANNNYGFNGLPPVTSQISIQGNGAIIERSSAGGTLNFRLFYVASTGDLTLQDVTLRNGLAQGGWGGSFDAAGGGGGAGLGGAIYNQGTLTVIRSTLTNNTAWGGQGGSANNSFSAGSGGGGLGGHGGGTLDLNSGGGGGGGFGGSGGFIILDGFAGSGGGGTMTNGATGINTTGGAGGVLNGGAGGNQGSDGNSGGAGGGGGGGGQNGKGGNGGTGGGGGGGGGTNGGGGFGGFGGGGGGNGRNNVGAGGGGGFGGGGGGGLTGGGSDFGGGTGGQFPSTNVAGAGGGGGAGMGGAIFNDGYSGAGSGIVTIRNSTISGNSAIGGAGGTGFTAANNGTAGQGLGGGIFSLNGTLTVNNSTLANNTAAQGGGSLYNLASFEGAATLNLNSAIVADTPGGATDCVSANDSSTLVNNGTNNLIEKNDSGNACPGALVTADPQLGALQNNGGLTATQALPLTSPALDQGKNPDSLTTDQRGTGFPRTVDLAGVANGAGDGTDIGAFEFIAPPTLSKAFNPTSIPLGGTATLSFSLNNPNANAALTGVAFTDTLPGGLVVATPNGLSGSCGSGVISAVAGSSTISLTNGTLAAGGACSFSVNVTGTTPGTKNNTTGNVTATQTGPGNAASATLTVNAVTSTPGVSIVDPFGCTGPGDVLTVTVVVTNPAIIAQLVSFTATLPAGLVGLPGSGTSTVGAPPTVTATSAMFSATLAPNQTATVTYQVQVGDAASGAQLCITTTSTFSGAPGPTVQACATINCPATGPGLLLPATAEVSDQQAGSVLVYNLYSSSSAAPNAQNTRIAITNTNPALAVAVHLFFVDGATCSIADSLICLTPNQTASFLTSDIDPGTTGYIVAVASDLTTGCPVNFNYLIGDAYVKLSSGHAANLAAEGFAALAGGLPSCDANSTTAVLSFDGVSYNRAPRALAAANIPTRGDGNDTLLVLNRLGGSLVTGAATLTNLFGLLYDDAENPLSFTFSPGGCQFRSSLSNNFPRIAPRFEQFIPAGRTGWAKFYATGELGLLGALINYNANAGTAANAFNQGHNLHKLTFVPSVQLTIPIFPPNC